jgi:formate-dependent nitrite reductase membrane component NrfD
MVAAMSDHEGRAPEQEVLRRYERSHAAGQVRPAVGTRGGPARWRRAVEGAKVALAGRDWSDARWSFLYGKDTNYSDPDAVDDVARTNHRMRSGDEVPPHIQGPIMHPAVWTWEVPLYFWFGGIATGSAFIAAAADLVGDHDSAKVARRVALGAAIPSAPLLILDLGRPERFLNMLRIFKPRSPMSMGAWCLSFFSSAAGGAVAADLIGRDREARALGGVTAFFGAYLGSYTGVLLASTAVPVWARSKLFLPPIFVCTAVATGAATTRLALAATGTKVGHPTRTALGTIETGAIATELALSTINEHRLGHLSEALEKGRPGTLFALAKWGVRTGLALRFARKRGGPWVHHLASLLYIFSGLAFRFAWVSAGAASAGDDEAVARTARLRSHPLTQEPA